MQVEPICVDCVHYTKELKCSAFPDGIPDDIIYGYVDHTKPYKGDHNIQYTPIKKKE